MSISHALTFVLGYYEPHKIYGGSFMVASVMVNPKCWLKQKLLIFNYSLIVKNMYQAKRAQTSFYHYSTH